MQCRTRYAYYLYYLFLHCACDKGQSLSQEVVCEYIPTHTKAIGIELPQFLPCPDGWLETNYDAGQSDIIPYCEPPE